MEHRSGGRLWNRKYATGGRVLLGTFTGTKYLSQVRKTVSFSKQSICTGLGKMAVKYRTILDS